MKNRIKELREEKGLTLEKLGEKVDIAKNTLSRYESGNREPKLETWQQLADYFDVSVPYLQGFDEHKPNRLKELRDKKKVSQGDLAKVTGLTQQAISNYENNERNPNDKVWQQLADYFEVSVPYLKGEIDTEYLEKLIELAIFFCFPKTNITYKDKEFGDEFKPFIIIGILSQIFNLLGSDSRDKFQKIYNKIILMADDQITFGFLSNFKSTVDETMAETEKITGNLLKAYDQL